MNDATRDVLLMTAVSGLVMGIAARAHASDGAVRSGEGDEASAKPMQADGKPAPDKDCCKGRNECKGKGNCKTEAHECAGKNECKGQGGCKPAVCP